MLKSVQLPNLLKGGGERFDGDVSKL